jgi:hypothetical protein
MARVGRPGEYGHPKGKFGLIRPRDRRNFRYVAEFFFPAVLER